MLPLVAENGPGGDWIATALEPLLDRFVSAAVRTDLGLVVGAGESPKVFAWALVVWDPVCSASWAYVRYSHIDLLGLLWCVNHSTAGPSSRHR